MSFCLINSSNFKHNINVISKYIDINKISFVIKNNAYGHGLIEIAKLASEYGVKHAVVCTLDEAHLISNLFKTTLVLQDIPSKKITENIIITINSLNDISKITLSFSMILGRLEIYTLLVLMTPFFWKS